MLVLTETWTRVEVAELNRFVFLFEDNLQGKGMSGQACIRGLSNAFGVPTKTGLSTEPSAFFTDETYKWNVERINHALELLPNDGRTLVYHANIGKSLTQLNVCAHKTYTYLLLRLSTFRDEELRYVSLPELREMNTEWGIGNR